jgi:hypothetical protein
MSDGLISQDMEFFQTDELVDKLGIGDFSSVDELNSITASLALPSDQMSILKEKMLTTIEDLPVSEASGLSTLSDSLSKASNEDISAILFQSGINPDTFSVETFGLDIASLTDFQSSVMGFNATLSGGCDALLALENIVTDIGSEIDELDLDNIFQPISDYMEDLAKNVEDAVVSVKEQFDALSSDDILSDIADAAESVVETIASDVEALASAIQADIESIDVSDFLESLEAEAEAIAEAFEASIEGVLEGVEGDLLAFKDSVDACFEHSKMVNEVKLKNYESQVEDLELLA